MMRIPGFDELEALDFVVQDVSPFVHLLYMRDIAGVSVDSGAFLEQQRVALSAAGFENLLSKQLPSGGWLPPDEESAFGPVHRSTGWLLIYFGYLGFNGTEMPAIQDAVAYAFRHLYDHERGLFLSTGRRYPGFAPCESAMLLRALLRLGFQDDPSVREACDHHLEAIHGREGACRHKRGGYPCAWGMTKSLRMLNAFPADWRTPAYARTVETIQAYLLSPHLAQGDFPRSRNSFIDHPRHWTSLGYFRSYQSDRFEASEALVESGVTDDPELQRTLDVVGDKCLDGVTWQPDYHRGEWPIRLEANLPSPFLSLRGLRIAQAL